MDQISNNKMKLNKQRKINKVNNINNKYNKILTRNNNKLKVFKCIKILNNKMTWN